MEPGWLLGGWDGSGQKGPERSRNHGVVGLGATLGVEGLWDGLGGPGRSQDGEMGWGGPGRSQDGEMGRGVLEDHRMVKWVGGSLKVGEPQSGLEGLLKY